MKLLSELLELNETRNEGGDWGSSDWYPIIQAMKKAAKSGGDLDQVAEEEAERYYEDMGYDSIEDAKQRILYKWDLVKEYHTK